MRFICLIVFGLFLHSCTQVESTEIPFTVEASGEMLFEGSNTLQGSDSLLLDRLARKLEIEKSRIEKLSISEVEIQMDNADRELTESFLLQIVSDNMELKSVASLNPIPEEGKIKMSIAEDTRILDYFRDDGSTWVLDLNLSGDHMEEMTVLMNLKGEVEFKTE